MSCPDPGMALADFHSSPLATDGPCPRDQLNNTGSNLHQHTPPRAPKNCLLIQAPVSPSRCSRTAIAKNPTTAAPEKSSPPVLHTPLIPPCRSHNKPHQPSKRRGPQNNSHTPGLAVSLSQSPYCSNLGTPLASGNWGKLPTSSPCRASGLTPPLLSAL